MTKEQLKQIITKYHTHAELLKPSTPVYTDRSVHMILLNLLDDIFNEYNDANSDENVLIIIAKYYNMTVELFNENEDKTHDEVEAPAYNKYETIQQRYELIESKYKDALKILLDLMEVIDKHKINIDEDIIDAAGRLYLKMKSSLNENRGEV